VSITCAILSATGRNQFDWRAEEAALNLFRVQVPLHDSTCTTCKKRARQRPDPLSALCCTAGRASVYEILDIFRGLTDPAKFCGDSKDSFSRESLPSAAGLTCFRSSPDKSAHLRTSQPACTTLLTQALRHQDIRGASGDWGEGISRCSPTPIRIRWLAFISTNVRRTRSRGRSRHRKGIPRRRGFLLAQGRDPAI